MANLPSAKKRVKQNERNQARNRVRKSQLKSMTRKLLDAVGQGDVATARSQFTQVTKKLDQIASKGTMHKNAAARKKSRLAKRVNALAAGKAAS